MHYIYTVRNFTKYILTLILMLSVSISNAQIKNYQLNTNKNIVRFPFKVFNNILLVDVKVNHTKTLQFIFDSGCKSTLVIHPKWLDSFEIVKNNKVYFRGLGYKDSVETIKMDNGFIELGDLSCAQLPIYILTKDTLIIDKYLGTDVDGIFGAEIFEKYYVHINYKSKMVELFDKKPTKKINSSYHKLPIVIRNSKGYLTCTVMNNNHQFFLSEFLLDTGSNIPVIIKNKQPEDLNITHYINAEIGEGLSGALYSNICRIKKIFLDTFKLDSVITSFNETPITFKDVDENTLDGNIGNDILNRFDIYYAYPEKLIYIKSTAKLNEPFDFNVSNIILLENKSKNNGFVVKSIASNSPPLQAGMQNGDEIIKIDRYKCKDIALEDALMLLNRRIGKKISVTYIRNGTKTKVTYFIKSII